MNRRDFLKLVIRGAACLPLVTDVNADEAGRKDLPLHLLNALVLERQGEILKLNLNNQRDYLAACYLLRDVQANRSAYAHPWLLRTLSLIQAMAAESHAHEPLIIHSGYRTPFTNKKVGGAEHSYHKANANGFFHATDFSTRITPCSAIAQYALLARQGGVGIYQKKHFTHVDIGAPRIWTDV